ncbi:hypothetical protein [Celeribacter sp.]|uniref:hypothetical protein n=1 Tax=Celeribacter sp. TaxID=1890673 RepID=UPI003A8E9989
MMGIRITKRDGQVRLREDEIFPQLIWSQKFAYNFAGTVSIPEFDDTKMMFYVVPCVFLASGSNRYDDDSDPTDPTDPIYSYNINLSTIANTTGLPSITWDNSTKVMTIAIQSMPAGWPLDLDHADMRNDYYINIVTTNRRVDV